jgi:RNA-directed DNA polymerase
MSTGLERLAAKARQEPKLRCTSLAHHLDAERLWHHLCHVPRQTAPGSDGQTVDDVTQEFGAWSEATLRAVHTHGYRPPPVRRTDIPKPGTREPRPLGVPCVGRPGPPAPRGRCAVRPLRAGLFARFVWRPTGRRRASRTGNPA